MPRFYTIRQLIEHAAYKRPEPGAPRRAPSARSVALRAKILALLRSRDYLTISNVVNELVVSNPCACSHLNALVVDGLAKKVCVSDVRFGYREGGNTRYLFIAEEVKGESTDITSQGVRTG